MRADAYAAGDHVVLDKSDLHTVAHEAAHVVQQRRGVQLKGGVGQAGDANERHADAVADKVVAGESAEPLLSAMAGPGEVRAGLPRLRPRGVLHRPRAQLQPGARRDHPRRKGRPLMTFDPSQHVGKTVAIRGAAYDARAGAILELEDRTPIYIAGLAEWDPALQGKPLEVTGLLQERAARVPPVPAGGLQVHGLASPTFVLENATWTALS